MTETMMSTGEQLHNFIDDLEKSLKYTYDKTIDCENIILCGMGGSAISGDIVKDCCTGTSKIPICVLKSPIIPNWANEKTLAIISSYSGNTIEMIEVYKQASEKKCKKIIITSGGKLEEISEKYNEELIRIPKNMHPRHSIGFMIGYTLKVLQSAGCGDVSRDIIKAIPSLKQYRNNVEDKINGPAIKLAKYYYDHIPVICASSEIRSVILRWKTQFNENSKYIAFYSPIPEFVYLDLSGWIGQNEKFILTVILNNEEMISQNEEVSDLMKVLKDNDIEHTIIYLRGKNWADNMFRALILGDYTSIYLAELQGIDPSTVAPITRLKEVLRPLSIESEKDL